MRMMENTEPRKSLRLFFFMTVCVTIVCFSPALLNDLLYWDDFGFIISNEHIRSLSPATFKWAFTSYYCNYWAPLTWLSLSLDYALYGLSPFGFHLTNLILHGLNAGLFFLLCRLLLVAYDTAAAPDTEQHSLTQTTILYSSVLAALIFAIHPLRVESVAWATERKDVLGMFFGLISIICYVRYCTAASQQADGRRFGFLSSSDYWCSLVFFAFSLGSKAMFVTLPIMLLVLDWYPLRRLAVRTILPCLLEKVPMLVLSAGVSYLTMQATAPTRTSYFGKTMFSRMLTVAESIVAYLKLFFLPVGISPVYLNKGNVPIDAMALLNVFSVAAISCYCLAKIKTRRFMLAAWLLFLFPLLPVLSVSGIHSMAPRFTYLPSLALSLCSALAVLKLAGYAKKRGWGIIVITIPVCMVLLSYAAITARDIGFWKNDIALWSRVIELQPNSFGFAYSQRSYFYTYTGEYAKALADIDVALAIATRKSYASIHEIYGERADILKAMRRYDEALIDLGKAIETSNDMFRGKYYRQRAKIHNERGSHEKAEDDIKKALQFPAIPGLTVDGS